MKTLLSAFVLSSILLPQNSTATTGLFCGKALEKQKEKFENTINQINETHLQAVSNLQNENSKLDSKVTDLNRLNGNLTSQGQVIAKLQTQLSLANSKIEELTAEKEAESRVEELAQSLQTSLPELFTLMERLVNGDFDNHDADNENRLSPVDQDNKPTMAIPTTSKDKFKSAVQTHLLATGADQTNIDKLMEEIDNSNGEFGHLAQEINGGGYDFYSVTINGETRVYFTVWF